MRRLHTSRDEQARRFLDRIDEPDKNRKFSFGDLEERRLWHTYMACYEDMIRNTACRHAPWHVVPGQWMNTVDARIGEFLRQRFAIEAARRGPRRRAKSPPSDGQSRGREPRSRRAAGR